MWSNFNSVRNESGEGMRKKSYSLVVCLLGISFALNGNLSAQQLATLNVTVTDPTGSVISGAQVAIKNNETSAGRTLTTSSDGVAVIPGLPSGNYLLAVESAQFSAYKAPITLSVGQIASVSVILGMKSVKEEVLVQESILGIDTARSDVSQVVDVRQISGLPISGRDFIDFVLLTPGANVGRSTAVGAQAPFQETVLQLSFGGLRESHSVFFGLDGTDCTAEYAVGLAQSAKTQLQHS